MNKERKHFDDLFREELKDFSQETSMADFDAIMGKMDNKKKRRFLFWWFFAGAGVIAIAVGLSWNYLVDDRSKEVNTEQSIVKPEVEDNRKRQVIRGEKEDWNGKLDNTELEKLEGFKNVESYIGKEENKNNRQLKRDEKLESGSNFKQRDDLVEFENPKTKVNNSKTNNKSNEGKINIPGGDKVVKEAISQGDNNLKLEEPKDTIKERVEKVADNALIAIVDSNISLKKAPPNKGPFVVENPKWRLELMGNYLASNRSITSSNNYAAIRESDEDNLATFNFGLTLHRNIYKNFSLGSGLEMNTYSYQADYSYQREEYDKIWVINPNNDTIGFFKDNIRDTTEKYKTTNQIKVFRVPVHVTFDLNLRNQGFRFGAGMYGEKVRSVVGKMPDQVELRQVNSQTEINESLLFGWNAELGYYRKLSNNLNFEIRTKYSASFSNLLKGNNAKDKPRLIGLGVGLSYKF